MEWVTSAVRPQFRIQSAKDAVIDEIRGLIQAGEIAEGERVSIDELAERFGVSRTPVRDALQQLSVEGLVKITPRVGVFVREISVQEITDVYQIKTALEPLMASWAAERGSEEQRAAFRESLDDLDQAARDNDVPAYVRLLEQRREALLAMAASDGLRDALGVLAGRVRLLEFRDLSQAGRLSESASQHRAIADAIAVGDPEAAYTAMQAHLQHSTVRVQELLASVEDPAATESPESSRRRRAARTPRR